MAQGYAYPVGASGSTGSADTATVSISSASTNTTIFTATQKTIVNSLLLTNVSPGIVPVTVSVNRGGSDIQIAYRRVQKDTYAVLSLVSGDSRVKAEQYPVPGPLTEVVLNAGDVLKASCPIANAVNVTAYLSKGVK